MMARLAYNYLGRSGLKVSNLCLGTMTFGEDKNGRPFATEEESNRILDRFVELGGNFIDTADMYTAGESEAIIGRWLKGQQREKIILATKFGRRMDPSNPNAAGGSRGCIMSAVESSLRRLQTSYIDLYYLHVFDFGTPLEETLSAMNDLVRSGKVRYVGLSNLKGYHLQKAVEICKQKGYDNIMAFQAQYNLLVRSPEWELTEVCENEGIGFLPWSPLKGGWLSGKMAREQGPASGTRVSWCSEHGVAHHSHPDWAYFAKDEHAWAVIDAVTKIAEAKGRSVPQVAIRWLMQKKNMPSVVIGARTLEQLEGCMGAAGDLVLSEQEMKDLDKVSSIPAPYPYDYIPDANKDRFRP